MFELKYLFMKNLLISLGLLLVLISFGTLVFMDTAGAQNNLVADLLNLPAPPPPNPLFGSSRVIRDAAFYNKKNPPGDDAPIGDLIDYWQSQSSNYADLQYNIQPSDKVLERLMEAVEENPDLLGTLINIFPENKETADFVKKIYDAGGSEEEEGELNESIETWLKYHSNYYTDQLLEESRQVRDADEYVTNQDELLALSRVDYSKAQPIITQLYSDPTQPVSQTLARWALYRRAIDTDSLGDIEKYRDELKATVENKQASPGMRDLAMDALMKEKDWSGREEWYLSLLDDETLADLKVNGRTYTGLTTIMYFAPPERYMDRMLGLLKSSSPTVRNAAVKNLGLLISKDAPEVVRALLPWLENPKWAVGAGGERARLIEALQSIEMPESVPGLIEIMEELREPRRTSISSNSNVKTVGEDFAGIPVEDMIYRHSAMRALGTQKDARAIPVLRRALNEVEEYERPAAVKALLQSHGFSTAEQVDGLEMVARMSVETAVRMSNSNTSGVGFPLYNNVGPGYTITGNTSANAVATVSTEIPMVFAANSNTNRMALPPNRPLSADDIKILVGSQLLDNPEAEEPLVNGVLDRINSLERRNLPTAAWLRNILQRWNGPAINAMMLRDLKNGKATLNSVVKLLGLRKELVEKQANAVYDARGGNPTAIGIAACILNNNSDYDAILAGENVETKIAMLACARLVRADLPVGATAALLSSGDKMLALAAERYLESNDSPEARAAVLALHPNEAKIMGATVFSPPGDAEPTESEFLPQLFSSVANGLSMDPYYATTDYAGNIKKTEQRLRKEVLENNDLLGIYSYDDNFIRIYKDKTVFSWEEDNARYYERTLEAGEFDSFKNFLVANRVDTLPPFLSESDHDQEGATLELLMLGKQGGRRVFLQAGTRPQFFKDLEKAFEEMRKPQAKLHYWLEKELPGLEILFTDDNLKARAVWKNGPDIRVLVENETRKEEIEKELDAQYQEESSKEDYNYMKGEEENRQRRLHRQYEHMSWRRLANGDLSASAPQPTDVEVIPQPDSHPIQPSDFIRRTRSGGVEVRSNTEGLYKIAGGQFTKLRTGPYYQPFMAPGGRWVLAGKYEQGLKFVRVNLLTGKEFPIVIEGYSIIIPIAELPGTGRVLISSANPGYEGRERIAWFVLDPETGIVQPAKGEFAPLAQQTFRKLQPASAPDEFWVALPDTDKNETHIGLYNGRTFTLKLLQKVPRISFSSMDMWVDEKENKIYLVYSGHLLALPLKK